MELLGHPALGHDDEAPEGDQAGQGPTVGVEVGHQLLEAAGGPVVDLGQALDGVGLQGGQQGALGGEVGVHGPHRAVEAAGQALDGQGVQTVLFGHGPGRGQELGTPGVMAPVPAGGVDLVLNHVQSMNAIHVHCQGR